MDLQGIRTPDQQGDPSSTARGGRRVASVAIRVFTAMAATTAVATDAEDNVTGTGGWPMHRGDVRLTGRASLPGGMVEKPVVAWQHTIEAGEVWVRIDPGSGASASSESEISFDGQAWGLGSRLVDLYGDGRMVPDPGRAAKLIPEVDGLQTITFEPAPEVGGTDPKRVVCYAYDGGERREVWRSDVFDTIQNTNYVVADVDGDGFLEIAFAPHYRVIVLDGRTGATKHLKKIHGLRNYGFFATDDVDRDGLLDFVIIADFAMHVDVVRNAGDGLDVLWRRDIEDNIQSKSRIIRPGPNPVLDIDGDGRREILFNLFNDHGNGEWHTVALDALTGETVLDLEGQYLHGSADVDGDGVPELFVSRSRGLLVPDIAPLDLLRVRSGGATSVWASPAGEWVTAATDLPFTHSTIVARGTDDVVTASLTGDARRAFAVREVEADGGERLRTLVANDGSGASEVWSLALAARSRLRWRAAADVDEDGVDEVLVSYLQQDVDGTDPGAAQGAGVTTVQMLRRTAAGTSGTVGPPGQSRPVVVAPAIDRRPALIVYEGAHHDLVALEAPADGTAEPSILWRVPGAGPAVFADLDGDDLPELVAADWAVDGEGEMIAITRDGKPFWRRRVPEFPGPHPPWNFGGITTWWVGRYTESNRNDVWVSARRSTMHSDEAWVLRGTDGEALWHLREVRTNQTGANERGWGAGGSLVASADVDDDGLDDILGLYPVNYMAARGTTGELIHSVSAVSGLFDGVWGAYSKPLVDDLNGDGSEELLWCGAYHHGLTTLDSRVLWFHPGGASMAGVGDVDGDGRMELAFTGWEGGQGLRCLDAATGEQRWDWPLEGNPNVQVYSADIDGNGRDEFLFTVGNTLHAVGEADGVARGLWKMELPATPGDLALADVDGDGRVEILFIGSDSVLYCLAAADSAPFTVVVDEEVAGVVRPNLLGLPYPNPFNAAVNIPFSVASESNVLLELFDLTGQRTAVLVNEVRPPGDFVVRWDGDEAASGVYLVRLRAGDYVAERKIILRK